VYEGKRFGDRSRIGEAVVLGIFLLAGLALLGYLPAAAILQFKAMDRSVTVKGLAEREVNADVAIWPIRFSEAGNDLGEIFSAIQSKNALVVEFLKERNFTDEEIFQSAPAIVDRQAQPYGDAQKAPFRYSGHSTITVYTNKAEAVAQLLKSLVDLGKKGVAVSGQDYNAKVEFLFTRLNEIKPEMIEEATRNARESAEKFAADSKSKLGKIKSANQGQFSVTDRDSHTPQIKKIRVVSTVEYYLSD
jgi:uncharacterized protein